MLKIPWEKKLLQTSGSQPYLPRGTLVQLHQYLAAPLDAKVGLKFNKYYNWRHP